MSADLTVNGVRVLEATIALPRVGNWHADLKLDTGDDSNLTGAVTIASADGSLSLHGTAYRVGTYTSVVLMRVVGGAGGLARPLSARYYRAVGAGALTFGNVLRDLLRDAGEALDPSSEAAVLNLSLPSGRGTGWTRRAVLASRALDTLMGETDAQWRMLASGQLWVGRETWPNAPSFTFDLLKSDKRNGTIELGTESFALRPGTTFVDPAGTNSQVSYVEYRVAAGATRVEVWYERTVAAD